MERGYEVRYEDLVSQPANELKRVCHFLEEPYDANIESYFIKNQLEHQEPVEFLQWKAKTIEKPTTSEIGKYKTILSQEEIKNLKILHLPFCEGIDINPDVTGQSICSKGFMMKNHIKDLAFFGGVPTFSDVLHVGKPNIGRYESFIKRINEMFERRWLTNNGPFVQEFEEKVADFLGVKHCIAMCNATVGLEIAARALGLTGEVIIPSFTFVATAHALQWQEITPVFCDIDPVTHNINPEQIPQLITPRTTGILGVHVWGHACEVELLTQIAEKHHLKLMFDAAHAFDCSYHGKMIGGFGDLEVFSFHATKFFNSFEGGMVATNDDNLAETIRSMRNFGFAGMDNVTNVGTNGKMSEVSAAMGLHILRKPR